MRTVWPRNQFSNAILITLNFKMQIRVTTSINSFQNKSTEKIFPLIKHSLVVLLDLYGFAENQKKWAHRLELRLSS